MKKFSSFLAKTLLFSFFFLAISPVLLPIADAFAQSTVSSSANSNVLVDTMCNVMKLVTGSAGKAFAAFAVISLGIGFFTGKVSWGLMIGIMFGIAGMFGAPTIVSAISGKSSYDCTNS
jgi:type IV secretory pathway VirB2 component (pilin)